MTATALTSLDDYKAYAQITSTSEDAAIQAMIDAATSALRRYASRDEDNGFTSQTWTETYDGNDSEFLELREFPLTSITSVTQIANDGSTTVMDSTEYRMDNPKWGVLARLGSVQGRFAMTRSYLYGTVSARGGVIDNWGTYPCWHEGVQNYTVVYVGGFSTIPQGLKYVVWRWTDQLRGKAKTSVFVSETIGDYAYRIRDDKDWRDELADLMRPYMRGVP